jgi:Fe2+ transport system protein B
MMGVVTEKNFIQANKVESAFAGNNLQLQLQPPLTLLSLVDPAPKKKVETQKNFLEKEDFGKVPEYLGQVKEQVEKEKKEAQEAAKRERTKGQQQYRLLSEEEKEQMIKGLKEQWETINNSYRQLPVAINTLAHKNKYNSN